MRRLTTLWLVSAIWVAAPFAQPRAIDTANSVLTVRVYKAGVLSAFGHNHEISAPITGGSIDPTAHKVELHVQARTLEVRDPGVSEKDRTQIQRTMLGPEVLDSEHNPEIAFRSTSVDTAGSGTWRVQGSLSLHGQEHPVTVDVRESNGHYEGIARLKQTEFGMQPVKVGGGTVRVKDEVQIEFKIQVTR